MLHYTLFYPHSLIQWIISSLLNETRSACLHGLLTAPPLLSFHHLFPHQPLLHRHCRDINISQASAGAMRPLELPAEVLTLICAEALQCGTSPSTLLTLNSSWHQASSGILYSCLAIPNSSLLLSDAYKDDPETQCSTFAVWSNRLLGKLRAILRNNHYAKAVSALYVLSKHSDPSVSSAGSGTQQEHDHKNDAEPRSTTPPNVDLDFMSDNQLLDLVTIHITSIRSLSWLLPRPPTDDFMKGLQRCSIRLVSLDFLPSTAQILQRQSNPANTYASLAGTLCTTSSSSALRWDAGFLQTFDLCTLVVLTLQNLSLDGVRTLGQLCSTLLSCEELSLLDTLFVDDGLLASIAESMPRLRALRIKRMAGTKVTNKGISSIMESAHALEELELLEFEGEYLDHQD